MIYTTNAIESLNSVIRHASKKRKVFPTDDSVKKWCGWHNPVCVPEMEDAIEGLAYGNEPLYVFCIQDVMLSQSQPPVLSGHNTSI
ncbi:transposase [Escherichia coli]|nr:transposase [Escherichia coli]GDE17392.1 transposase [Escherichia coli]GDE78967.1 transposase [Escherichia coli]GDU89798.1 transposase [Escherichia coli]